MPKYDYVCSECGLKLEAERSYSEAGRPAVCPLCGGACAQAFAPPTVFSKGTRIEQLAAARAHWAAKGQGAEIAGHEPPGIATPQHPHNHGPGTQHHSH